MENISSPISPNCACVFDFIVSCFLSDCYMLLLHSDLWARGIFSIAYFIYIIEWNTLYHKRQKEKRRIAGREGRKLDRKNISYVIVNCVISISSYSERELRGCLSPEMSCWHDSVPTPSAPVCDQVSQSFTSSSCPLLISPKCFCLLFPLLLIFFPHFFFLSSIRWSYLFDKISPKVQREKSSLSEIA